MLAWGAAALALAGAGACATIGAGGVTLLKDGLMDGAVDLRWENPDRFVYKPVAEKPLFFSFPDSYRISTDSAVDTNLRVRRIEPQLMYTDGGSIPRPFWSTPGLAPFDYLPAYVLHDWLYLQKRCHSAGKGSFTAFRSFPYSRGTADDVLASALDRIDATHAPANADDRRRRARARAGIMQAVREFGGGSWDGKDCDLPPPDFKTVIQNVPKRVKRILKSGRSTTDTVMVSVPRKVPRYTQIRRFSVE